MSYPTSLPLPQVTLDHGFLAARAALVRKTVIPWQWEALNDRIEGAERSGCVHNLQVAAGVKAGKFHGLFWQDSDLAKWIEAASYRLATHPDAALDAELDALIAVIARAQGEDGYLNTYFQLVEPENRWRNLRDCHELYVAGHFIEAGVAHFEATGKRTLINVATRLADMIGKIFGPAQDQVPGYCGHEEVELALVKLSRATGEARYRELAAYFVNQRGQSPNYFEEEAKLRGDSKLPWHMHHDGLGTLQAARPVDELTEPVGHAVRMMYLLAAMIDLAGVQDDPKPAAQCRRIWGEIVGRHLYVTGGVGTEPYGEKFCEPFDLPPDRACSETCAAIGVVMCARRMLDLEMKGEYADVMERALYNNVLAGLSLDGRTFFYVNPLEVVPAVARRRFETHLVKTQRVPWFGCACCPPNIARLLASIGGYAFSQTSDGLAVHLYTGGSAEFHVGSVPARLVVQTEYPWEERVEFRVEVGDAVEFTLQFRLPGWCRTPRLTLNGVAQELEAVSGYAKVCRRWKAKDRLVLDLPMPVERVRADARVSSAAGKVALQRGPVVYCLEEIDNGSALSALRLPRTSELTAVRERELLGGCVAVEADGLRTGLSTALYSTGVPSETPVRIRAVPYALWANRGEGEMRVWLRES